MIFYSILDELSKNMDAFVNISANKSDKWIVITTIFKPTMDIMKMSATENWNIVIVADTKTPMDWTYKNCIFLSIEVQQKLDYKILRLIPYNSYTRKMIGYLYAIENGAKLIYDTDDDNLPTNLGLSLFDYSSMTSGMTVQSRSNHSAEFFNVYSHFGRSDVWPRGYPLQFFNREIRTNFKLCRILKTPIIQQGLVDQDADVDAIYRMIYVKNKTNGMDVTFDPTAPPIVMGENVYCSFNSQNTLFHYESFWALLLPISVAFRVTDIWRGYWAQRLLHLIGNHLGFYGPNARQNRNPHSYFKDFLDERQLYIDTASLVETLQQWQCSKEDFQSCIIDLSELMVQKRFWGIKDLMLTKAWISDLVKIGYRFPKLTQLSHLDTCRYSNFVSNHQKRSNNLSLSFDIVTKLNRLCYPVTKTKFYSDGFPSLSFNHTKNVVLIVILNKPHFSHISFLQFLYEHWFANVIFCGSFPSNLSKILEKPSLFKRVDPKMVPNFSYVNLTLDEWHDGYFGYICLNKVADMKIQNVDGFLTIADDMLLNFWNPFRTDKIYFTPSSCSIHINWTWWYFPNGLEKLKALSSFINSNAINLPKWSNLSNQDVFCVSDIYYVPFHLVDQYRFVSQLFFDHKVFLEIALVRILYSLGWANNVEFDQILQFDDNDTIFQGKYIWGRENRQIKIYEYYKDTDMFLHAVKMSLFKNHDMLIRYCDHYLSSMMNALNGLEGKLNSTF